MFGWPAFDKASRAALRVSVFFYSNAFSSSIVARATAFDPRPCREVNTPFATLLRDIEIGHPMPPCWHRSFSTGE